MRTFLLCIILSVALFCPAVPVTLEQVISREIRFTAIVTAN